MRTNLSISVTNVAMNRTGHAYPAFVDGQWRQGAEVLTRFDLGNGLVALPNWKTRTVYFVRRDEAYRPERESFVFSLKGDLGRVLLASNADESNTRFGIRIAGGSLVSRELKIGRRQTQSRLLAPLVKRFENGTLTHEGYFDPRDQSLFLVGIDSNSRYYAYASFKIPELSQIPHKP